MSSTVYAAGRVVGLSLQVTADAALAAQLRELGDGPVDVTIRRFRRNRSTPANAYLWGVVYALLAEHTGYAREELHEICKAKFLPREVAVCDGNGELVEALVLGGSTAKLDTAQFAAYVEAIRQWAGESLGITMPDPGAAVAA